MNRISLRRSTYVVAAALLAALAGAPAVHAQDKGGTKGRTPQADRAKETKPPRGGTTEQKERVDRKGGTTGESRSGGSWGQGAGTAGAGGKDARPAAEDKGSVPGSTGKLWAAQTDPTLIRLSWDRVPEAVGYRIFCAVGGGAPRMIRRLAANALSTLVQITPAASSAVHQCLIEAEFEKGRVSEKAAFNPVTPVAKSAITPSVPAPTNVVATETAPGEITLTWDEVPGATAYSIARSVFPNGLQRFCELCPTGGRYVDRDVTPGVKHTYAVTAVTPGGVSRRLVSNTVTPGGGGDLAGGGGGSGGAPPGGSDDPKAGPTDPKAAVTAPGTVTLTWNPAKGATEHRVYRSVNGGPLELVARVAGNVARLVDRPVAHARVVAGRILYRIYGVNPKGASDPVLFNEVVLEKLAVGTDPPSDSTPRPSVKACTLEYQRADNGWAAQGRPDGNLGVEKITLEAGKKKVFSTDWKYERERNDGANYYGSHLRVATNAGERPVRMLLKGLPEVSLSARGVRRFQLQAIQTLVDGGYPLILQPGYEAELRHDLMEVSCPE